MSHFLVRDPMILGGFEGFEWINLKDQQGSERFSCSWSKLDQGGEIFLPHHSSSVLFQFHKQLRKQGRDLVSFCRSRAHYSWEKSSQDLEVLVYGSNSSSEFLDISRVPFIITLWRVYMPYSPFLLVGWNSWGGHNYIWGHWLGGFRCAWKLQVITFHDHTYSFLWVCRLSWEFGDHIYLFVDLGVFLKGEGTYVLRAMAIWMSSS